MARALDRFSVEATDGGFTLHIEDDAGDVIELAATRDQLELIADELDELLEETEGEEGEGEEKDEDDEEEDET
jgi:hypothetical protein